MGTFLLFILITFLVIFSLGISFLRGVMQLFSKRPNAENSRPESQNYQNKDHQSTHSSAHEHQKVFSKDEGEYVDYEEIKKD